MDLIFYNGDIITIDSNNPAARAVAVKGEKIAAVGGDREIISLRNSRTEVIDLAGRTLLPGFNDSHMHLFGYALNLARVDLSPCTSVEQVIDSIRNFIREQSVVPGEWVLGWGWDQSLFSDNRVHDRHDLDRASSEHCITLMRTCCHICLVNTMALKQAGIFENPPEVNGGAIPVDDQGKPTGVLEEKAMQLVTGFIPALDRKMLKSLIMEAGRRFLATGLTSVQTDDLMALGEERLPDLIGAYRELEAEGELPVRINLQLLLPTVERLQEFLDCGYRTGQGGSMFKIGPL